MARKKIEGAGGMAGGDEESETEKMDLPSWATDLTNTTPLLESAVKADGPRVVHIAPPRRYLVKAAAYVMIKGVKAILRAGKILDAANYDIANLRSQGIELVEVEREDAAE
jgi:hypothetical protein